jgi:hypothetical protein
MAFLKISNLYYCQTTIKPECRAHAESKIETGFIYSFTENKKTNPE